jgi:hypothetical protein
MASVRFPTINQRNPHYPQPGTEPRRLMFQDIPRGATARIKNGRMALAAEYEQKLSLQPHKQDRADPQTEAALLRFLLKSDHHPRSAPQLNVMAINQPLGFGDSFHIVGANNRFEPYKMPVDPYQICAIFFHPKVPLSGADNGVVKGNLSGSRHKSKLFSAFWSAGDPSQLGSDPVTGSRSYCSCSG